jgi:hypothetical protein
MSVQGGPDIVENGLILCYDPANIESYVSGSTNVFDLSTTNSSGSLVGGLVYATGSKGTFVLDGINDYIQGEKIIEPVGALSISAWFKSTGTGSNNDHVGNVLLCSSPELNHGYFLSYSQRDKNIFFSTVINNGTHMSSGSFESNVVNNVVATWDGSTHRVYSNARLVGTRSFSTAIGYATSGDRKHRVGRWGYADTVSYDRYFQGDIYNVSLYNRALSQREIQQNYDAIRGRFPNPPANISASFWLPFEFDTLTTANLEANDNSAGTWTINNTRNLLGISGSVAQFRNTGSVNYIFDPGTRGLAYNVSGLAGGGAASDLRFFTPVAINKYSMRFYYYLPSMATFNVYGICGGLNASGFGFDGNGIFRHIKNPGLQLENVPITAENVWYRVEIYWERNGPHIQSIYDAAGQLVGTWQGTAGTQTIYSFSFLSYTSAGGTPSAASNAYMDNLIIDWVNAKFPIGP